MKRIVKIMCGTGLLLALCIRASPAQAQVVLSDEAQLSLVTVKPGDAVYSMFGHSAVRVYDPSQDLDVAFNYGTFDFGNPIVFVGQFAYGKLDYFLNIEPYPAAVRHYGSVENRPIIEQVLNLSPGQRQSLFQFLYTNALPENRYYRYDFFFDNCATRIRDVFEQVLGEAVQLAPPDPGLTFRELIDLYATDKPLLDAGMDTGLGLPADRIATPRETLFLPDYLYKAFDGATVSVNGSSQPLVVRTDTMAWNAEALPKTAWPWPAMLGWLVLGLSLGLTALDFKRNTPYRRLFDSLLFGAVGLAGLLIFFLWFISLHSVTQANLNLLWAWPTHLLLAVAIRRRWHPSWRRMYLAATLAVALVVLVRWPFWPQALPAVALPIVLMVVVRSGWLLYYELVGTRFKTRREHE